MGVILARALLPIVEGYHKLARWSLVRHVVVEWFHATLCSQDSNVNRFPQAHFITAKKIFENGLLPAGSPNRYDKWI